MSKATFRTPGIYWQSYDVLEIYTYMYLFMAQQPPMGQGVFTIVLRHIVLGRNPLDE